jgi:hypothetical protein
MDDLFNNILVYLPIIFIVLFRLLGLRNRQTGKRPAAAAVAAAASPEPTEPVREKPPERRSRKEPPRTSKAPAPEAVFSEIPSAPPPRPQANRAGGKGFPENLAYLPALKRAMVLAEIIGPPKALQGGRQGFGPSGPQGFGTPSCAR